MGTLTAEMPVAATGKPLLTVIRPEARPAIPRLGFIAAFDLLGQPVGVYSLGGALLHQTAAFRVALDQGEVAALVRNAVAAIAGRAAAWGRQAIPSPVSYRDHDRYIRASLYRPAEKSMVLVCIEAAVVAQPTMTDEEVVARYALTPAQVRVARLLAAGAQNKAIASSLGVSTHTARHHTEHVLRKLRINSRAAVAGRLRGETPWCSSGDDAR